MVQSKTVRIEDDMLSDLASIAGVGQGAVDVVRAPLAEVAGELVLAEDEDAACEPFDAMKLPAGAGSFKSVR